MVGEGVSVLGNMARRVLDRSSVTVGRVEQIGSRNMEEDFSQIPLVNWDY